MGIIREQLKTEIQRQIREQIAENSKIKEKPRSFAEFQSNIGREITDFAKAIVGIGYQMARHPIETAKTAGAATVELGKRLPSAAVGLTKEAKKIITQPIATTREVWDDYRALRSIPYKEQKKIWNETTERFLAEEERGKKLIGIVGSGMLGTTISQITHPLDYAYENPVSFALDALTLGQATGATKLLKSSLKKVPATHRITIAMKELFKPYGKLEAAGYSDVARDLITTKGQIFREQRRIIEDTAKKFYKEFALTPKEQREFFDAIDSLRRTTQPIKASSENPKIQKAIDWWLDEEVPKLREASGLSEERAIANYLHHFFPEKFKPREVGLTSPLMYSKRGYLKPSKDVEGFSKDPVLSISVIKSKVAVDNLRDGLINRIINRYGVDLDEAARRLIEMGKGREIARMTDIELREAAIRYLDLEEFKPRGILRFYPTETGVGVTKRVETYLLPKPIVDELNKFIFPVKGTLDKLFLPFDIFNRNWKPLATAIRPRYHLRNILGNIYNSIVVGGMNPKEIPVAMLNQVKNVISQSIADKNLLGKIYKTIFKKDIPQPHIMKLAIDNDILGRGFFGADVPDLITAIDKGDDIMRMINNINTPAEIYKIPILKQGLALMQKAGQFIEDNARLAMFQEGLRRFGGDVALAKDYVNKHLFDYLTGLGEADKFIRRFIPFWSWSRFNIPLQAEALAAKPLKYSAMMKITKPYVTAKEIEDKGYEYLSEQEKEAGYVKVGVTVKEQKEYAKYIKTASVLPLADLGRLARIFQGQDEEIGFTPLAQIYSLIFKDPTKFKNFFGRPIEAFKGERTKFLGVPVRGRTKELLSTIPLLTELNKAIGGSYFAKEKPDWSIRFEQAFSPFGLSLVDIEKSKFLKELAKERELKGSYSAGLESLYRRYTKIYLDTKDEVALKNIELLEKELLDRGLTKIDILKLKNQTIKSLFRDAFRIKK